MNAEDQKRFERCQKQTLHIPSYMDHDYSFLVTKVEEVQAELAKVKEQRDGLAEALKHVRFAFGGEFANGPFEDGIIRICCEALANWRRKMLDTIKASIKHGVYSPTALNDILWLVGRVEELEARLTRLRDLVLGDEVREKVLRANWVGTEFARASEHVIKRFQQAIEKEMGKPCLTPQATGHEAAVLNRIAEVGEALEESGKQNKNIVGDVPEER